MDSRKLLVSKQPNLCSPRKCSQLKFVLNKPLVCVQCKFDVTNMSSFRDITYYLHRVRQPLADYQEHKGVPKEEIYSFLSLLTTLCQHSYNAFVVIFAMLYNLSPMVDTFLYLIRFLLDKIIEITESQDMHERTHKLLIFSGQLIVVAGIIFMIWTLILSPIINLVSSIAFCTWGWINPNPV